MAGMTPTYQNLYIAGISVDFSNWGRNVHSAEAWIGDLGGQIQHRGGQTFSQDFTPPMKLSSQDSFCLRLLYESQTHHNRKPYEIPFNMDGIFRFYIERRGHGMQECHISYGAINIVLRGVLSETPNNCLRLRILVIGKTGVGKSSLIHHAFGVENALASNFERGQVNIDTEFIPPQNNRFVLHDSEGFEAGEEHNVDIVHQFIERRGNMLNFGERLHAVWLCLETPRAGGRLMETGTEDFLKLKGDGRLGNIPVIVVFTKYDGLINQFDYDLGPSGDGLNDHDIKQLVERRAGIKLRDTCIRPVERFAGSGIPIAAVSTEAGYEGSLIQLIQMTENACV
ncbi:hypothetical protein M405DRAFT_831986 [Rhizopogon salebrosus TDB-379]|nr:hypothetical protein M405DRAFT_831986 [Rhizopogon salebrosus TDB-379]